MSHAEQGAARQRSWRVLLVGLGVGAAACALSLLMQSPSASAAQQDDGDTGVLGLVGTTLSTVGSITDGVSDVAQGVGIVQPVAVVLAPVAPVVEFVDRTITHTTHALTDAVSSTAGDGILTGAVDLLGSLPVVGGVTDGLGVTDALAAVTQPLDGLVADVIGVASVGFDAIIPSLDLGSVPVDLASAAVPMALTGASATLLAGGIAIAVVVALTTPLGALAPPSSGSPGSHSGQGSGAQGGQGPASGVAALLHAPAPVPRASVHASRDSDDALPGAPVFDTDTSPD